MDATARADNCALSSDKGVILPISRMPRRGREGRVVVVSPIHHDLLSIDEHRCWPLAPRRLLVCPLLVIVYFSARRDQLPTLLLIALLSYI
jgi:hypothetical protein